MFSESQSDQCNNSSHPRLKEIRVYTFGSTVHTSVLMSIPRTLIKLTYIYLLCGFSLGPWNQSCTGHLMFHMKLCGWGCDVCVCLWVAHPLPPHPQCLVTFACPTTEGCSHTFGNPSWSCSPESRLCCVILSGQVKADAAMHSLTPDIHREDQQITLQDSGCRRMNKTLGSCFAARF